MLKYLKILKKNSVLKHIKLIHKCNTLELENERLEDIIKNKLFDKFMQNLSIEEQIESLKNENKKYRDKIKELKSSDNKL